MSDLLSCPYCKAGPIESTKPAYKGKPWDRLGPLKKYECPNGHMTTRFWWFNKADKAWNTDVAAYQRIIDKAAATEPCRAR